MVGTQLFIGKHLLLTAIDPEKDARVEAEWSLDLDYTRQMWDGPAHPLTVLELRKHHEAELKKAEDALQMHFAVHLQEDSRLLGFLHFPHVYWSNHGARLALHFGRQADLDAYGAELMGIALHYGFDELNLHQIAIVAAEFDSNLRDVIEQAGFELEVCRREAVFSCGRFWDMLEYGMLERDWRNAHPEE